MVVASARSVVMIFTESARRSVEGSCGCVDCDNICICFSNVCVCVCVCGVCMCVCVCV